VLVDGRVAERGTHRELLAAGGVFARMWDLQSQQAEPELEEEVLEADLAAGRMPAGVG
jgi:ATP-binding cassette subfamily B protein